MHSIDRRAWRNFDFVLLGATFLLIIYGVAMIYSAVTDSPGLQDLPQRQAIYAVVGIVIMLLIAGIDYRLYLEIQPVIYIAMIVILGAVLLLGQVTHGAQRWFDLVLVSVQPSELAKLLLTITLAAHFAKRQEEIQSLKTFVTSFLYVIPPVVLIYLEPSLSTVISLAVLWLTISFVAGVPWRYLLGLGAAGLIASPVFWFGMADYQRDRILLFINPAHDPDAAYNLEQALISIGSGGWFGKGFGLGSQSQLRFLRVRWSDFIFSVIGEELGLLGVVVLVILLLVVVLRLFRNAEFARDPFGRLIAAGVGSLILFQTVVNIGMNVALLPATGIPLPFISSGGSSLVMFLMAEGIVQSINLRRQKIEYQFASRV